MDTTPDHRGDSHLRDDRNKRQRVLDGARTVFLSYGYQRATMEDIARAADMSRPALYLMFRNKADIYRALGEYMFQDCSSSMCAALRQAGTLGEKLNAAISRAMIDALGEVASSPNGAELLDLKNSLAGDMVVDWTAQVASLLADAIEADARARAVDLGERGITARSLAEFLLDSLEGMRLRIADLDEQRAAARRLIRVIELATS